MRRPARWFADQLMKADLAPGKVALQVVGHVVVILIGHRRTGHLDGVGELAGRS